MSPVIEQFTDNSQVGTDCLVTLPTGLTVGNLLVLVTGYFSTYAGTGLTGWTEQQRRTVSSQYGSAIYTRVVDGTESLTYTMTGFASGEVRCVTVLEISGHNGVDTSATTFNTTASTSWPSPSLTTTVPDCLIIRPAFNGQTSKTGSFAFAGTETLITDYYSSAQSGGGYWGRLNVSTFVQDTAAATGTVTVTPPTSNKHSLSAIAIKPQVQFNKPAADTGASTDAATLRVRATTDTGIGTANAPHIVYNPTVTDAGVFGEFAIAGQKVADGDVGTFSESGASVPATVATVADSGTFTDDATTKESRLPQQRLVIVRAEYRTVTVGREMA